ncbi:MAG: 2-oxoacid:acceptor oxidoreductase family protein, partial [Thermoplasmata archaeon]
MKKEIRIYGFGGQGIITLGHLIGESAVEDKKEVIMTEEYSPYITGGWSRADIIISDSAIDYPLISGIDFLITLSQEGLDVNKDLVRENGLIFLDSDLVDYSNLKKNIIAIKAKKISEELKNPRGMNIVIFGTFVSKTGIVSKESAINAIKKRFP